MGEPTLSFKYWRKILRDTIISKQSSLLGALRAHCQHWYTLNIFVAKCKHQVNFWCLLRSLEKRAIMFRHVIFVYLLNCIWITLGAQCHSCFGCSKSFTKGRSHKCCSFISNLLNMLCQGQVPPARDEGSLLSLFASLEPPPVPIQVGKY